MGAKLRGLRDVVGSWMVRDHDPETRACLTAQRVFHVMWLSNENMTVSRSSFHAELFTRPCFKVDGICVEVDGCQCTEGCQL